MTEDQQTQRDAFRDAYEHDADRYENLVAFEDYQGNLLKKIEEIAPIRDKTVVEFGAGTGRISTQLQPLVKSLCSFDLAPKMLRMAHTKLTGLAHTGWGAALGDNRQMPVADGVADVALEGWSFGHLVSWYPDSWRKQVDAAVNELERVTRPGGTMILIETEGTGHLTPTHHPLLVPFVEYLEQERGYTFTWIRTDYRYESAEAARDSVVPMFGEATMVKGLIETEEGFILPECTGLWWKRKA